MGILYIEKERKNFFSSKQQLKTRCPRCPYPDHVEAKGLTMGSIETRTLPRVPTTEAGSLDSKRTPKVHAQS